MVSPVCDILGELQHYRSDPDFTDFDLDFTDFTLKLIIGVLVIVFGVPYARAQKTDLRVEGSILMYSIAPKGLNLNYSGASAVYVVKILKVLDRCANQGDKTNKACSLESDLVLVVTPREFKKTAFSSKKKLEFSLTRVRGCDSRIKDFVIGSPVSESPVNSTLKASVGVDLTSLPIDDVLPCYLLREQT